MSIHRRIMREVLDDRVVSGCGKGQGDNGLQLLFGKSELSLVSVSGSLSSLVLLD